MKLHYLLFASLICLALLSGCPKSVGCPSGTVDRAGECVPRVLELTSLSLKVDAVELLDFDPSVRDYDLVLPFGTELADVSWSLSDPGAVSIDAQLSIGEDSSSVGGMMTQLDYSLLNPVNIDHQTQLLTIEVSSEELGSVTYTLEVTRPVSNRLIGLDLMTTIGSAFDFDYNTFIYDVTLPWLAGNGELNFAAEDPSTSVLLTLGQSVPTPASPDTVYSVSIPADGTDFEVSLEARDVFFSPQDYSLTLRRAELQERAFIKASNADENDSFGSQIAIDGNRMAVIADDEDGDGSSPDNDDVVNSGAIYIFERDLLGIWHEVAYLKAPEPQTFTRFERPFGNSLSLNGDILAVSASSEDSDEFSRSGAVHVFERHEDGTWQLSTSLKAPNASDFDGFGRSVAVLGDTIVVGATGEDSSSRGVFPSTEDVDNDDLESSGAVYVFTRNALDQWIESAFIKASDAEEEDFFGRKILLDGNELFVGASSRNDRGALYVFERDLTNGWAEVDILEASMPQSNANFGSEFALSNNTLIVGAPFEDHAAEDAGTAYIFERDESGTWQADGWIRASNADASHALGSMIAIEGNMLVFGVDQDDSNAQGIFTSPAGDSSAMLDNYGSVLVFERGSNGSWSEARYIKASNAGRFDWFGKAVALSQGTLIVGAHVEDTDARGVFPSADDVDNDDATGSGAVYIFR